MQSTFDTQNVKAGLSNESAFDQEGPSKMMKPPSFSLSASEDAAKVSNGSNEGVVGGNRFDIRQVFNDYISKYEKTKNKSVLEPAARVLMQYYGIYDESLVVIKIVDGDAMNGDYAWTIGDYGENQTMELYISPKSLTSGFETAARILGHEYQHMLYYWNNADGTEEESEFLAYYFELFESVSKDHPGADRMPPVEGKTYPSLPMHNDSEMEEEAIALAYQYYNSLPIEIKEKYQAEKKRLDQLGKMFDLDENTARPDFGKHRKQ